MPSPFLCRYAGGPEILRHWRTVHAGDAEEPRLALIIYPLRIEVLRKLKGPVVAELHIEKQARLTHVPSLLSSQKLDRLRDAA